MNVAELKQRIEIAVLHTRALQGSAFAAQSNDEMLNVLLGVEEAVGELFDIWEAVLEKIVELEKEAKKWEC